MSRESKIKAIQKGLAEVAVAKYATFASSYNDQLLNVLEYLSPKAVAAVYKERLPEPACIVDLGCGTGLFGLAVLGQGIRPSMVGVDISQAMLDRVPAGVYAELCCGDVCAGLPFPDGSFEGAVSIGLSEYVIDLKAWFTEVARLLQPGAPWMFTYVTSADHSVDKLGNSTLLLAHSRDNVQESLGATGFVWERDVDVSAYFHGGTRVVHNLAVARKS